MRTGEFERDLVGSDIPGAVACRGHHPRDSEASGCVPASGFPEDANAAIYRPAKSAMTSGKAGTRHWVLEFEPRSPLYVEPLMGWTGGSDPLRHVKLLFPTKEAAMAYARSQGLCFAVREPPSSRHPIRRRAHGVLNDAFRYTVVAEDHPDRDKPSPPTTADLALAA
ncbi:MAG TPA: ETC complex I subunit [Dongiaceae bacterium]|nr:ETC complex I subunit [Dongiaceae bacterium]